MNPSSTSSSGGRHRAAPALVGIILVAALAILIGWGLGMGEGEKKSAPTAPKITLETPTPKPAVPAVMAAPADKNATAMPESGPVAALATKLRAYAAEFRALMEDKSLDEETRKTKARALLSQLRDELRKAPADVAAAAIVQFLDSGADSSTGLGFTLTGGGLLEDAPSMRTAMLDMLGQLDPNESVSYAQKIFNGSRVPDEWALAMRNLGWQNQVGVHNTELRTRLSQLLDNQNWLANPSQGFLEAFDTAVHLGGLEDLANMASVMRLLDANGQVVKNGTTHAAYIALDRITTRHPDQTLPALANDPDLLSWSPEHRGALMARADVSQPVQRSAIETYLGTLSQRPQELETFTGLFPNRNGLLGNALITTPREQPSFQQLLAQDQAALAAVQQWLQSGRYAVIEPNLRQISARLTTFIRDATAAQPTNPPGNSGR